LWAPEGSGSAARLVKNTTDLSWAQKEQGVSIATR